MGQPSLRRQGAEPGVLQCLIQPVSAKPVDVIRVRHRHGEGCPLPRKVRLPVRMDGDSEAYRLRLPLSQPQLPQEGPGDPGGGPAVGHLLFSICEGPAVAHIVEKAGQDHVLHGKALPSGDLPPDPGYPERVLQPVGPRLRTGLEPGVLC